MLRTNEFDKQAGKFQSAGKISFYMPSFGETAATVASVAALEFEDPMYYMIF